MKYCSQCDNQYPDHNQFCPDCGQALQAGGQNRGSGQGDSRPKQKPHSGGQQQQQRSQQARSGGRQQQEPSSGLHQKQRSGGQQQSHSRGRQQQQQQQQASASRARGPDASHSSEIASRNEQVDLVGREFFGEYTIVDQLGEGGMGAVYLAEQNSIDQKIALKVLHAESAESDEIVQRFHREANVISMLTHPNIVRVFIFGRTDDDLLFLAMEHVEGFELREKLDGTPLDELMAIKVTKQICSAVAAAHDQDIIHRDLKPENILLTTHRGEENYVKILDFGIAKLKHPDGQQGPQLTQAGIVYGTPEYLSPEQAQAEDLDHRTDIYALGCMLFEMMTGQVPFDADSSVEILKQKVFEEPPKPSDFAPVAPKMEKIILTAMAQDRGNRYTDALEMFDALVVREQELQKERQLDRRDTYVPGSELTGHHQLEALQNAKEQNDGGADASGGIQTGADGSSEMDVGALDETVARDAPEPEELRKQGNPSQQQQQQPQQQQQQQPQQQQQRRGQNQQAQRGGARNRQQQRTAGQPNAAQSSPTNQAPQRRQQPGNPQQNPGGQPRDSQTDLVRYALMATVVVLAIAVTGLFIYLVTILVG